MARCRHGRRIFIPDAGFRRAVADYLVAERRAVEQEIDVLAEMGPFRRG